tara:strand:+ start:387 stop:620 length:234 start_codon:yes stop_codon:yes gene_type:complete
VIKEKKNDNIIAVKFNIDKLILFVVIIFPRPKSETAPRVGIDSKKEIFAASYLSNLSNLPAVIVIPDLLTPGINDRT